MKKFTSVCILFFFGIFYNSNVLIRAQSSISPVLSENLQFALDNEFAQYDLKGVVMAISMPDDEIWFGASGTSNGSDSINAEMLFGIGSNTKTFTATLAMMLIEDSLLKLDDSIYHWVADNPYIDSTITVKNLLNHTSGLYEYTDHPAIDDSLISHLEKFWTPEEILLTFLDTPYFEKGKDFHYANTNYLILGMIIKAVSGKSISEMLHSRILNPLGLTHTFLDQEDSLVGELAHCWYDLFDNGDSYDLVLYDIERTSMYSSMWTAGAMFSTAEDMVKWSKGLYLSKLVNDSTLAQMLDFLPGDDYGLGINKYNMSGRELWGHGGDVIYKSFLLYSPFDTISITLLCNDDEMTYSQRVNITEAVLDTYVSYLSGISENAIKNLNCSLYPNPAQSEINLNYVLYKTTDVQIDIFTFDGKLLKSLSYNNQNEGKHDLRLNREFDFASGMYLCKLNVGHSISELPFVIIK
jgi:D-alanyl-D-alanine carboxypeptidase